MVLLSSLKKIHGTIKMFKRMNYIKLFELYNNDDFYTILDPDTIEDDWAISMKMTPSEISKIMSLSTDSKRFFTTMVSIKTNDFKIEVRKYEDEWFVVKCNQPKKDEIHYKCDGLEGVEKCINNIMNN